MEETKKEQKPTVQQQIDFVHGARLILASNPRAQIVCRSADEVMLKAIEENLIAVRNLSEPKDGMSPNEGKKNVYECPKGHTTVTVDRAQGVTSFIIACPECECEGENTEATSRMYRVPQTLIPSHEWYKPTEQDLRDLKADLNSYSFDDLMDHVNQGGLLFRKIKEVSNG